MAVNGNGDCCRFLAGGYVIRWSFNYYYYQSINQFIKKHKQYNIRASIEK